MELSQEKITQLGTLLGAVSPIAIQRTLAGGKSGAGVWLVDAQLNSWSGSAILKLERLDAVVGRKEESIAHRNAVDFNPNFAKRHIAKLIAAAELDGFTVSLFEAAGGGLENCQPLKSLSSGLHKSACEKIAEDLLGDWNKGAIEADSVWPDSALLQAWLGYRLDTSKGGRITDRFQDYSISETVEAFSFGGNTYPNPLYWSLSKNLNCDGGIRPILGFVHNDLHGENAIIVDAFGSQFGYFLIDLALAEGQVPLLFDQAYIELSTLLFACNGLGINAWVEENSKLASVSGIRDLYENGVDKHRIPIADSIAAIRHVCRSWISGKFQSRKTQVQRQQMLARVAVGLNFLNKSGLEKSQQLKALLYSAVNLRAYFEYCKKQIPEPQCSLLESDVVPGLTTAAVRDACHFVDSFEKGRSIYVLVSTLDSEESKLLDPAVIAKVNWSLVLDLDASSGAETFFGKARSIVEKINVVRLLLPDRGVGVTASSRSTVWVKARGHDKAPGSVPMDFDLWRRKKLQYIRNIMAEVFEILEPLSIRLVVVQGKSWQAYSSEIGEAVFESAGIDDVRCLWLGTLPTERFSPGTLFVLPTHPVQSLLTGIELCLGSGTDPTKVLLPCRGGGQGGVTLKDFTDIRELAIVTEDLEIVHAAISTVNSSPTEGNFLRGAPITWGELELEQDLRRDLYDETVKNLEKTLADPRNRLFEISHKPGAGGTTFARRLLWNYRGTFPTVVLRSMSDQTASRIETMFHLCSLPVLILAEADICSKEDAIRLLHSTSSRNVRCCVLFVCRLTGPAPALPISDDRTYINDVMNSREASRFLGRYSFGASTGQQTRLRDLTHASDHQKFRCPFFYGLYRFEDGFSHVRDYVRGHLKGLDEQQQQLLAFASLISVFTQGGIPERLLASLAKQKYGPGTVLGRVFGQDVDRLFVSYAKEDYVVKASHPLIAQQVLEFALGTDRSDPIKWREQLSALSHKLIELFREYSDDSGVDVSDIFMQLFIQRDYITDTQSRKKFSALLEEIGEEAYQAEILRRLTQALPNEPHFWNHYGRHCMYSKNRRLNDAIEHLKLAIDLAPNDEVHHHTLGVIYALRVQETLLQFGKETGEEVNAWHAIDGDYRFARDCFQLARALAGSASQHPFVSDIQLITRTIHQLRHISRAMSFLEFLKLEIEISSDLREELASAENLLIEVKRLTDEVAVHTTYVEEANFHLRRILSDSESLIAYLHLRLEQAGGDTVQNRRFLLSVNQQERWHALANSSADKLDRYLAIAERNLDVSNPVDQDFRHWFNIYRESARFNYTEAIDKVSRWYNLTNSLDSAFYLYTLYFTQWYDGAIRNSAVVQSALDKCLSLSQERNRRQSFEFLAAASGVGFLSSRQLGQRDPATSFYLETSKLAIVDGTIKTIAGPQAGTISITPRWFQALVGAAPLERSLEAFFLPGEDFHPNVDENTPVQFFLGFRRGGLRAHVVKRN